MHLAVKVHFQCLKLNHCRIHRFQYIIVINKSALSSRTLPPSPYTSLSHSFLPLSCVYPHSPVSSSVPDDYIGRRNLEHVEALQENAVNPNQVVIGYGRGLMVIWDLEKERAIQHILATQVTAL